MKRRDFLKSTAAAGAGGILTGLRGFAAQSGAGPVVGPKPNILFILVDELRYPTVFPGDIQTPGDFLSNFMPNVYLNLWQKGVKFGNYNTAANACTPSRGVLMTGLYSQQNWLLATILSTPYPPAPPPKQPVLNPAYPTFGRLLQAAGYRTPYIGKWHVSVPVNSLNALENYGFDYYPSYYDPTGDNLQGTYGSQFETTDPTRGYLWDGYVATQAIDWLTTQRPDDQPWCLTVSLVNPHDREFFPAGTEFQTYTDLFANSSINPTNLPPIAPYSGDKYNGPLVPWDKNDLKSPQSYGYHNLPPNWESANSIANKGLKTQVLFREFQQGVWGGIADDPTQGTATIERYPSPRPLVRYGVAKMPFSYWQRGLDSYTQVMQIVDGQIGRVLDTLLNTLPKSVSENTVIVFASDHGEYSGAHGFVQGKLGTVYEEAWHIPLIVVDPSHRFTADIDTIRMGLTSSVDLSTLLVSIGNNGTRDWMKGDLRRIYGERLDMISMLQSADAPGRPYVLYATDEIMPNYFNFNAAPTHVLGLRTDDTKLGLYAKWVPFTSEIISSSKELEFYDYTTTLGKLELDNTASTDPRVKGMEDELLHNIIPHQLQQPLPGRLRLQQEKSKVAHLAYRELIALQPAKVWQSGGLQTLLGYGAEF